MSFVVVRKKRSNFILLLSAFYLLNVPMADLSFAQEAATESQPVNEVSAPDSAAAKPTESLPPEVLILNKIEEELREKYKNEIYIPPAIPSLFFTSEQQSLLREARNGFNTRIPSAAEINESLEAGPKLPTGGVRSLSLGGIVFINPDEWTIWLNKKRITLSNMPSEIIDLRVYKEFIELKWFDAASNQIFPIRLRPNQTFSLDSRTFVPG